MIVSRKGLKATFAILMGFMLAMLVDAGAHALPDDSPGTGASVSAKTAQAGQQISFTATGFPAGATVYVQLDDGATHWDSSLPGKSILHKKVPASGKVSGSVVLPANVAPGAHWLRFNATAADPNGGSQQITCRGDSDFTVVAPQGEGGGGGQPGGNAGDNQGNGQGADQGNGQGGNQGNGQGGNNGGGQQQPGGGPQQQGQPGAQQGVAVDAQGRPLPPGATPSATSTVKIGGQIMTIAPEAASPVPTERPKNTAKKTPTMPPAAPKAAAEEESGGPNMGVVGGMALVFVGLITATLITNRAKAVAAGSSRGGASGIARPTAASASGRSSGILRGATTAPRATAAASTGSSASRSGIVRGATTASRARTNDPAVSRTNGTGSYNRTGSTVSASRNTAGSQTVSRTTSQPSERTASSSGSKTRTAGGASATRVGQNRDARSTSAGRPFDARAASPSRGTDSSSERAASRQALSGLTGKHARRSDKKKASSGSGLREDKNISAYEPDRRITFLPAGPHPSDNSSR